MTGHWKDECQRKKQGKPQTSVGEAFLTQFAITGICKMTFYTKPSTEEFLKFVQDLLLNEQQTDEHYDESTDGFCFLDVTDDSVALHAADGSRHIAMKSLQLEHKIMASTTSLTNSHHLVLLYLERRSVATVSSISNTMNLS